jgi:hypothetical protein
MTDLEHLLRADLAQAADGVDTELDADTMLASAQRARGNRRIRRGVAAMAVALMAGTSVWVGIWSTSLHGGAAVVATPSVPAAPSTATAASEPDYSNYVAELRFTTDDIPEGAALGLESLTLTFRGKPGSDIEVRARSVSGTELRRSGAVAQGEPFVAKLSPQLWVMVAPTRIAWAGVATARSGVGHTEVDELHGLGVLVATAEPGKELTGFIWQDQNGLAWNDKGARIPGTVVTLGDRAYSFAHDLDLGLSCSSVAQGGLSGPWRASCAPPQPGGALEQSGVGGKAANSWDNWAFVVLPERAAEVTIEFDSRCQSATSALTPGTRIVILLSCRDGADKPEPSLPTIHYRDAAGKTSYSP